jgi:hypothetical protein
MIIAIGASAVIASGFPPVSEDDAFVVTRGGTASVLSDGSVSVLDNDFDAENDPLTAVLTRGARRGQLTFNGDGTFVYRHNGGRRSSDEFRYVAFDGTGFSEEARVRISITSSGPVAPQIVGQDPVSVNEDSSLTVDIRRLKVVDPDNDFPRDFTLEVGDGANYVRSNITITPTPNFNGQLAVPVRVFDGVNFSNSFTLVVDVLPRNDAPFTVGAPSDQEAIENNRFTLALARYFDDIDEQDSLRFSASGLPGSRNLSIDPVSGVLSGTPRTGDARNTAYSVRIIATDSGGASASVDFKLVIYRDNRADLAVTAGLSVNPVSVDQTAQWNIIVENLGPADLEEGELVGNWRTSGPTLSLSVPQGCAISGNDSRAPAIRCSLNGLAAGTRQSIVVQGTQSEAGDNSLIAIAVSDDPIIGNNSALTGAQVVGRFSEGPAQILSVSGSGVAGGDLNGDGQPDLAVTSDQTIVFFNDGNRSVATPGTSLGADSGGTAIVILDWNGDSSPDIAVGGVAGMAGRVYLNDGNGSFAQTIDLKYSNSGTIFAAAAADFSQDGFVDLVLTGSGGSKLLRNTGQSGFSVTSLVAGPGIDVSVADVNGDSYPDIVIVESSDRSVRVLRNSGDGRNFSSQRLQRGSVAGVSSADLNGNGRVDLLLAIDGEDLNIPESRILYQSPDGTFPIGDTIGASPLSKLLAGDVDGDSLPDIIALNGAGVHQLYRGNPGGGFVLNEEQIVSAGMRRGVLLDFNNDQSVDLIMAGPDSSVVEIHANNGIGRLGRGDRIAPVVLLNGEAIVTIPAGGTYEDPGATATDDIDGDLTASLEISGSFNTSVVGSYKVSYSVSDRAGNLGTAIRTINVGINEGAGGGGGGVIAPLFLILQALILIAIPGGAARLTRPGLKLSA